MSVIYAQRTDALRYFSSPEKQLIMTQKVDEGEMDAFFPTWSKKQMSFFPYVVVKTLFCYINLQFVPNQFSSMLTCIY